MPWNDRSRDASAAQPAPEEESRAIPPLVRLPSRDNSAFQEATAVLPDCKPVDPQLPGEQTRLFPSVREDASARIPESQPSLFSAPVTRQLPEQHPVTFTGILANTPASPPEASRKRALVVIKGEMKKAAPLPPGPPDKKRRLLVNLFGLFMLCLILGVTFLSVSPVGRELGWNFQPLQFGSNLVKNRNPGTDNLVLQATATAIYHHKNDGYDPYYNGSQVITRGGVSLNWPVGECTYWANYEYHQLSGQWVPWSGNAADWVAGAQRTGWVVSRSPRVPSIIVLMPGVQGASSYGHVAVVVRIIDSMTVETSNMNWYANGGGFDRVSYVNFTVGVGVYFVWHP